MQPPQIPGVRLDSELGRGAHSIVYRGEHELEGACAVKIPQTRARWTRLTFREAVALARVKHSGLPAVFDVGVVDDLPYLVMELVQGETLADRLDAGALPAHEVISIAGQLASVLSAVHDVGLVHRDVKPRNIIIDANGGLKLVDFGFTTPMERTGTGETAGTAAYAAPEQLVPPGRVDARSDLFCVGRVLYECLLGDDFPADNNRPFGQEAGDELLRRQVPEDLARIVTGLLYEEMDARYPDARALEIELALLRNGRPVAGAAAYPHEHHSSPTVARVTELEQILEAFRSQRAGGLVVVHGPRGAGKSRLVDSAVERLSQVVPWSSHVRCFENDPALATLRRILEAIWADGTDRMTLDEQRALLGNLAPLAALVSPRIAAELAVTGSLGVSDVQEATDALGEGVAEILVRYAHRRGRGVILVDDLQWIDSASAEALVRVAYRLREVGLTLILASRDDGSRGTLGRFLAMRDEVAVTDVALTRLREEAVAALISSYLGMPSTDPLLVGRVNAMADGTPLGVLAILGVFLDAGALRPRARGWTFDPSHIDGVVFPTETLALLGRRLAEIPPATRRILEVAAIWGAEFSEARVASVFDVTTETVGYATVTAHRAGIIEPTAGDAYRFVHDSLRETLLVELSDAENRRLHQRAGEILANQPSPTSDEIIEAARHFAHGDLTQDPQLTYRVASAAAKVSLEHFDEEAALAFVTQAVAAATMAKVEIPSSLHRISGEAHIRGGAVREGVEAFERALASTRSSLYRAEIYGRIAWAHGMEADPDKAWRALGAAFHELGERLPVEDAASTASTMEQLLRAQVHRFRDPSKPRPRAVVELLCQLHYQNGRLAFEYAKAARIVQSSLVANALSAETDSLAIRARARAIHGCTVAIFGRPAAGAAQAREALDLAKRSGEPTAIALCIQMLAMTAAVAGDQEKASAHYRELLDVYGPWTDLHEYTLYVMSGEIIKTWTGRPVEAWEWLERAVHRARRSRTTPRTLVPFVHRARAALASLGREADPGSWLANQFERISVLDTGRGFHRILSWGPRAKYFLERNDFGPAFEALVRDFAAEKLNPRTVIVVALEYYLVIAHARLQQCYAASPAERAPHIAALAKAADELRAAARIDVLKAHSLLIDGALASLRGSSRRAEKLLAAAESLASEENVVWVLSSVARVRAHALRAAGKHTAARDQARIAVAIARQHGAVARMRVIRKELDLAGIDEDENVSLRSSKRSSRTDRQLNALLQVAKGTKRDAKIEQLAASILDELLSTLNADRAAIWFQPELPSQGTAVARHRNSVTSVAISEDSPLGGLLRDVHRNGISWPTLKLTDSGIVPSGFDSSRLLVVPIHLYEHPVGALAVERGPKDPEFVPEDRQLLEMLSHQVPIALEISRLLAERERLQTSLQQAQKLEAIGQLAGGLAHDFNNMLAAMKVALSVAQERAGDDEDMRAELDIIGQATTRATQLTAQLLSFSRSQPRPMQLQDVNQLIVAMEPMLRRVATSSTTPAVNLKLSLSPILDAVSIDSASFDQALMNLLINARDAMPKGGTFSVSTRNVNLDEDAAMRANVPPGAYVEVEVGDTGEGMSPEVLNRIFEPFFTTKPVGRGTGLGLATVYGFVKNCGGGITVASDIGAGTRFTLYLKRADRPRMPRRRRITSGSSSLPISGIPDTILVVDDDDLVRRSIAKILERNGYRVMAASGSIEALEVARSVQGKRIGLVIMDVLLPGVTGPELGRRLNDLLTAKTLFVSGFSAESAPIEDAKVTPEMLLQKPFTQAALLERVRALMPS